MPSPTAYHPSLQYEVKVMIWSCYRILPVPIHVRIFNLAMTLATHWRFMFFTLVQYSSPAAPRYSVNMKSSFALHYTSLCSAQSGPIFGVVFSRTVRLCFASLLVVNLHVVFQTYLLPPSSSFIYHKSFCLRFLFLLLSLYVLRCLLHSHSLPVLFSSAFLQSNQMNSSQYFGTTSLSPHGLPLHPSVPELAALYTTVVILIVWQSLLIPFRLWV